MLGPVIGSILYSYIGYFGAFSCFASILLFAGLLSMTILPSSLNAKLDVMSDIERAESVKFNQSVPYKWFFTNRRSFFGLITCTIVCFLVAFPESFFTPALKQEKGVPEIYHGLIVCVQSLFFVMGTFVVGYVINKLSKRVFMTISFAACSIALLLLGPSYILGLPNFLWILLVG